MQNVVLYNCHLNLKANVNFQDLSNAAIIVTIIKDAESDRRNGNMQLEGCNTEPSGCKQHRSARTALKAPKLVKG